MYDSLKNHCKDFHLYIFAFDEKCYEYLKSQNLDHITVISLMEFEDVDLINIKSTRTPAEYCWTCTPSTIKYCITTFNLDHCTYIDADLLFFSDPNVLIEELGDDSILLTEHRYTAARDLSERSGIYCVQFITFRNNNFGRTALEWWRNACLEWCYARHEDGKFGDQKYLDDWTSRFKGVHVLKHLGGGLAPWNIQQYNFSKLNDKIIGQEINTGQSFIAVFYHYHGVRFFKNDLISLSDTGYTLSRKVKKLFYQPYIKLLVNKAQQIVKSNPLLNPNGASAIAPKGPLGLIQLLKFYWYDIKESPRNIFAPNMRHRIQNYHYHNLRKFY